MLRARYLLPVLVGFAAASTAQAAVLSSVFTSEASYASYMSSTIGVDSNTDRLAVGIARVGNNQLPPPGTTTWPGFEAGLFIPNPQTNPIGQGTPGNTVWPTTPVPFTFTRSGDILTFTVGTFYTGTWQNAQVLGIDTIAIQSSSQTPGGTVLANSMTWNELAFTPPPPATVASQTAADGGYVGQVLSQIAAGDFSLTGSITLAFDNAGRPQAGQLSFRLAAFDSPFFPDGGGAQVPAPAALALFGVALLGLFGVAACRRA